MNIPQWTGREIALLRENYPLHGPERCVEMLPRRSVHAIQSMASRLQVRRRRPETAIRNDADPAVRFLLQKVPGSLATHNVEAAADLGHDTVRCWKYRASPRVDILRRALNALGYDLAVVDLDTKTVIGG